MQRARRIIEGEAGRRQTLKAMRQLLTDARMDAEVEIIVVSELARRDAIRRLEGKKKLAPCFGV